MGRGCVCVVLGGDCLVGFFLIGEGVWWFFFFNLRPCAKLFKYILQNAISGLNTPASYLYNLQNLLSPRQWFPRFGWVPVKLNHIRGMTFILGGI